ncbi:unnamed protein product [Meloidogyne enterolobii]|uniref:Uncharacterized protein n=1 Tax=Meloidogyne enterolobii TaxID=390850 RepID=A0ACB0YVP5_MELEN
MNHLPGLLETEPSVCSCLCGKDHIRVLNEQEKENFDLPTTVSTDSNKKSDQKISIMSKIWNYFKKTANVAFCSDENCNYSRDFLPKAPTTPLIYHLKTKHPQLYSQYSEMNNKVISNEKRAQVRIEEALRSQSTSKDSFDKDRPTKQPRIEVALEAKSKKNS